MIRLTLFEETDKPMGTQTFETVKEASAIFRDRRTKATMIVERCESDEELMGLDACMFDILEAAVGGAALIGGTVSTWSQKGTWVDGHGWRRLWMKGQLPNQAAQQILQQMRLARVGKA